MELPEQRRNQHDQWDIERKPSTRFRPVYRIGLICVRCYRGYNNEQRGNDARDKGHDAHLEDAFWGRKS